MGKSGSKNNRSKTGNTSSTGPGIDVNISTFKPLFDDLFDGSVNSRIDPFACIPFATVRKPSESGVERLISLFDDEYDHHDETATVGLALGSDIPLVVPLTGDMLHYVYQYFRDQGKSEDEVEILVGRCSTWYGIVDGLHRNLAVKWLKTNKARW